MGSNPTSSIHLSQGFSARTMPGALTWLGRKAAFWAPNLPHLRATSRLGRKRRFSRSATSDVSAGRSYGPSHPFSQGGTLCTSFSPKSGPCATVARFLLLEAAFLSRAGTMCAGCPFFVSETSVSLQSRNDAPRILPVQTGGRPTFSQAGTMCHGTCAAPAGSRRAFSESVRLAHGTSVLTGRRAMPPIH